jgi:acetyltransferase-like isoleucine patch superfamily enzyme
MLKSIFWFFEDIGWNIRCRYNYWLHGPYGLSKVIERIPYRFLIKYLRKYGATVGVNCRIERGLNIHRPIEKPPFKNLVIEKNVYLGHNTLIDLSRKVCIKDNVIIASGCQIWTHTSYYSSDNHENMKYNEHYGEVVIGEASIIYSGVIIKHGITIGKRSDIGAGSVVIDDVTEFTFSAGSPSKVIRTYTH